MRKEDCSAGCQWSICPRRYVAALQKIGDFQTIDSRVGVSPCFSGNPEKTPKNGDLIILYAMDAADLDTMVDIREAFDGLKKILVVGTPSGGDDKKYHLLEPRYITQAGCNIADLEAVIHKMAGVSQ